jgi:hypothetical protein
LPIKSKRRGGYRTLEIRTSTRYSTADAVRVFIEKLSFGLWRLVLRLFRALLYRTGWIHVDGSSFRTIDSYDAARHAQASSRAVDDPSLLGNSEIHLCPSLVN